MYAYILLAAANVSIAWLQGPTADQFLPVSHSVDVPLLVYSLEAHGVDFGPHAHQFNWSMSLRPDATIWNPYSRLQPYRSPPPPLRDIMHAKTASAPVLWIATNCRTNNRREQFVSALRRHVQVHVAGRCLRSHALQHRPSTGLGASHQPSTLSSQQFEALLPTYKFYLSFENSCCEDYVTEKFYRALNAFTVPVVMGTANIQDYNPNGAAGFTYHLTLMN